MKKNSFLTALLVCVAMLGAKAQNKTCTKRIPLWMEKET